MNGKLGVPAGGFPEPLRSRILKGKPPLVKDGLRPGQQMGSYDFETEGKNLSLRTAVPLINDLKEKSSDVTNYLLFNDVLSYSLYPEVH